MKEIIIRQEKQQDHPRVFALIERAFRDEVHTDHLEQYLVERIRHSEAFVPALSLVAERDNELVGHILLSKIGIQVHEQMHESLALAPLSVSPSYRKQGIGGSLIRRAHQVAAQLGFTSVVLLGHADYYPRFGYRRAAEYGILLPFDVPEENCMAIELSENALRHVNGMVVYPEAFFA